jgi:hypothetical protein
MPMYFFDIHDRLGVIKDTEGMELGSMDEVRAEAVRSAREMIAESRKIGSPALDRMFAVRNAEGEIVLNFRFGDAVLRDTDPRQNSN